MTDGELERRHATHAVPDDDRFFQPQLSAHPSDVIGESGNRIAPVGLVA